MNISKEILNTIDGLGERFGADLCEGLVNYKLTQYWIEFGLLAILTAIAIWCLVDIAASYRGICRRISNEQLKWENEKYPPYCSFWSKHHNWEYCNCIDNFRVECFLHKVGIGEVWLTNKGIVKLVAGIAVLIGGGIGLIFSISQIVQCYITPKAYLIDYIINHIG